MVAGLAQAIDSADEETWKRLAAALGVASRQEAAELCASNPGAATKAREILGVAPEAKADSLLTAEDDETLLTRSKSKRKSPALADMMYGKSSGVRW